ncbi:hypothetical protein [Actinokineospora enzanensis]|uniref:hypothetical protein n=1 Tax=Actinokineospora enzanensis TaxID=155975 RepID=UPI0003645C67|nr:hypothetical protein [Actinokineospora enzanensis]
MTEQAGHDHLREQIARVVWRTTIRGSIMPHEIADATLAVVRPLLVERDQRIADLTAELGRLNQIADNRARFVEEARDERDDTREAARRERDRFRAAVRKRWGLTWWDIAQDAQHVDTLRQEAERGRARWRKLAVGRGARLGEARAERDHLSALLRGMARRANEYRRAADALAGDVDALNRASSPQDTTPAVEPCEWCGASNPQPGRPWVIGDNLHKMLNGKVVECLLVVEHAESGGVAWLPNSDPAPPTR